MHVFAYVFSFKKYKTRRFLEELKIEISYFANDQMLCKKNELVLQNFFFFLYLKTFFLFVYSPLKAQ